MKKAERERLKSLIDLKRRVNVLRTARIERRQELDTEVLELKPQWGFTVAPTSFCPMGKAFVVWRDNEEADGGGELRAVEISGL